MRSEDFRDKGIISNSSHVTDISLQCDTEYPSTLVLYVFIWSHGAAASSIWCTQSITGKRRYNHTLTFKTTRYLQSLISFKCMSLNCGGGKLKYPWKDLHTYRLQSSPRSLDTKSQHSRRGARAESVSRRRIGWFFYYSEVVRITLNLLYRPFNLSWCIFVEFEYSLTFLLGKNGKAKKPNKTKLYYFFTLHVCNMEQDRAGKQTHI